MNNMNKEEALKRLDNLEAEASALRAIINAPEEKVIEKWEPKGTWFVDEDGKLNEGRGKTHTKHAFGNYFPTEESANKAAIAMRKHNRILAYVLEHAPDYKPDWCNKNSAKWMVSFDHEEGKWVSDRYNYWELAGVVFMPEHVAIKLCDDLNSGRVVL